MKQIPEAVIQQECFNWFNNKYCLNHLEQSLIIHSVPNGINANLTPNEMARALDFLNKTGMKKGVSDLLIHGVNGRCIWAECKRPGEKQSEDQIKMENKVKKLGGIYFIFYSLDDFKEKILLYLPFLTTA